MIGAAAKNAPISAIENSVRIRIRGLSVDYGTKAALRDVDLDVATGRITALIGPSGCGKSSLLASLDRMTDLFPGRLRDGAGCLIESGSCRKVFEDPKDPDAAAYLNTQRG